MSARAAATAPRPAVRRSDAAPARRQRPSLQVVRAPEESRSRLGFLVLCMSILAGALLCALLLNTAMANGSYSMSSYQVELGRVAQDTQTLQTQVEQARSALPASARALGMVEAQHPAMLSLADGTLLGVGEGETTP
ncbi:hypothetical protein CLV28_2886 [Sediminihabitans luteus]|uniref:Cell division protein FtsL n=1 Tax=Sediminihabitans luteus TaxID=1138585 RepID=A0A2M9CCM3_9CELL|nr:hypothetical protein [Sediminihabitans luteus]PJJ69076.1 hypothetical protein CLV28_2886 [Sediminihabitans luteus]GII99462.1 hypothetical protein Slu03_18400 [Sediminihabitans luteus]